MRILHVVDSLNPGGMENGVVNMAALLSPIHDISVACLRAAGPFADRLPSRCPVHVMEKKSGFSFGAVRNLRSLVRSTRPDVVHTHNLGPLIYASLATSGGRSAAICHGEHAALRPDECTFRRRLQRRLLYRCCTAVHTVSGELTRQITEQHGFRARRGVRTVINGVDCVKYAPAPDKAEAKRRAGLPAEGPVLGIVGRLARTKRHAMLLDAFDAIGSRFSGVQLLIVGSDGGEGERVAQRIAASPFRNAIHSAGFQAEPAPFYQAMDLLVIPSENEGLSNAMLEAMACGVPVLSSTACGGREVIEDGTTGFLRDTPDAAALASSLEACLKDPVRLAAAGSAARAHVAQHFSIESMAAAYEMLYADCEERFRNK